jgi:zinc protease
MFFDRRAGCGISSRHTEPESRDLQSWNSGPCLVIALLATLPAAVHAASGSPVDAPGFSHVRTVGDISEYTLAANGLTVLLMPERSAPVVTFMVTYRVGSRNEVTGTTGATHLLEHLMFKGSPGYNDAKANSVKQFLETVGGNYNATTWLDRTNYYAVVGRENLEGYVTIEADRMRNLWLREEDRRLEMTVVRNEFEIGENDPREALDKEVFAAAFQAHPYHHSTIGWRSDIENVPIEKLRSFYDTFYWPDNATVSVIGDFEPATALALVRKYYGAYPRAPKPIPQLYTVEPEQTGPRRVTVRRTGEVGVAGLAYKIPEGGHADHAPLNVLSMILGSGKTSRFYRALTDRSLTLKVDAGTGFFHDPSLLQVYAYLTPGVGHEQVEKVLLEEIERLKKEGVTESEVATALGKYAAATAFGRDGAFSIAGNLNEAIAAGDWTLYYTVDEATKRVTAADVTRVANTYLDVNKSTTGWFIPLATVAPAAP